MPPPTPLLGGRLEAKPTGKQTHDLYWQGRERATFRYYEKGQLQLLSKPTPQNIRALFDIARETGMHPPLALYGSMEFQRMAAEEARRRGIEVIPDDDKVAREHADALKALKEAQEQKIEQKVEQKTPKEPEKEQREEERRRPRMR